MEFDNYYLGAHRCRVALSEDELVYFRFVVGSVINILGIAVDVRNLDHWRAFREHDTKAPAFGILHVKNPQKPWDDCFITIDNLFIHNCYVANLTGFCCVENTSLEEVLCHQIAHIAVYRDCKHHKELSNMLVATVRKHMDHDCTALSTYEEFRQMEPESFYMISPLYSDKNAEGA